LTEGSEDFLLGFLPSRSRGDHADGRRFTAQGATFSSVPNIPFWGYHAHFVSMSITTTSDGMVTMYLHSKDIPYRTVSLWIFIVKLRGSTHDDVWSRVLDYKRHVSLEKYQIPIP
jgi:hypothetical protein